jgi:hypothetical protein
MVYRLYCSFVIWLPAPNNKTIAIKAQAHPDSINTQKVFRLKPSLFLPAIRWLKPAAMINMANNKHD